MIMLRPGTTASSVLVALGEAKNGAVNLRSGHTPAERLQRYRSWSSVQVASLQPHLTTATLEGLLLTRRHWLLHGIDVATYGEAAAGDLVDLEIGACIARLEHAHTELLARMSDWARWGWGADSGASVVAIILDTSVLMRHTAELLTIDWHARADQRRPIPLALGIPMTVVDELDKLKAATGEMVIGEKSTARRTLARRALTWLDGTFQGDQTSVELGETGCVDGLPKAELRAVLISEELRRDRLPRADLDILDQARGLKPYSKDVQVATYDHAMIFRARSLGLRGFKPVPD